MVKEPQALLEVASLTDFEAREHLESIRWPEGPVCPHCGDIRVGKLNGKAHRQGLYKCYGCRRQFSVTVGTVMHRSHITLKQWVLAFYSICAHKKGISAVQLQRDLGLGSYKSAWHLAHRIRAAMEQEPMRALLKGTIEADETYVGGKSKQGENESGSERKTPDIAIAERDGRAVSQPVVKVDAATCQGLFREKVTPTAQIRTGEMRAYCGIDHHCKSHHSANHSQCEFANGPVHINTCESYFALLKQGVHGTFHHISRKHMARYCKELIFRWNHRKVTDGSRTRSAIRGFSCKRLEYGTLIGRD